MKRTSLVLALGTIVLTSCVAPQALDLDVACRNRTTTLNHARNSSISHTHPTVDMCQGFTLTIRVVPPIDMNKARSTAQDQTQAHWLSREAADGRTIVITVPDNDEDDIDADDEFKYSLTVDEVGVIDPTIRIIQ